MMKTKFITAYQTFIKRDGADKLLKWIESTDFFTAPASTKYHLSKPGGLVEHSMNVFRRLTFLVDTFWTEGEKPSEETIAIVSLLHDLCKANYYSVEMRNKKNEQTGQWEKVPFYIVDDQLPYGHGEKSVYIISAYMKLSREEAMAIRWHMGGYEPSAKLGDPSLNAAFAKFPLALMVHLADMMSTHLDEKEDKK